MVGDTRVIQITNIAPSATRDQMKTLFSYVGKIDEVKVYPEGDMGSVANSKVAYVKFDHYDTSGVALHLTNTVFVDRPIIVTPVPENRIPDEHTALQAGAATNVSGALPSSSSWPPNVINQVTGMPGDQQIVTIDPKLTSLGLPNYPPLPGYTDPTKIEEIRRTVYVGNLDGTVIAKQLLHFFTQVGEVKYVAMAGENITPRSAYVEFTDQTTIATALTYNGVMFAGRPISVTHATSAITKPLMKNQEAAAREIEEAMKKVREAQSLITAAVDPDGEMKTTSDKHRSQRDDPSGKRKKDLDRRRSRSRSRRRRSRSRSGARRRSRSRSKKRSRSRSRRSRSSKREKPEKVAVESRRKSRSSSPSRRRSRRKSRSRSRKRSKTPKRKKSRSRSPRRKKSRSKSREKKKRRSRSRTPPRMYRSSRKSRSKSRERRRRSHSRGRHRSRSYSRSPARKRSHSKSLSPPLLGRASSVSPERRKRRSRSPPPRKKSRSPRRRKSRSPRRRSRSRSGTPKMSRKKDKKRRSRSRDRDSKKRKHREKDKDRDRDRSRDRSKDRDHKGKDGKVSKDSKVRRDYDEEEKGYASDGDKEAKRVDLHVEEEEDRSPPRGGHHSRESSESPPPPPPPPPPPAPYEDHPPPPMPQHEERVDVDLEQMDMDMSD